MCCLLLEAATLPQSISQYWKNPLPPIETRPAIAGVRLSPEEDTEQDAVLQQVLWVALPALCLQLRTVQNAHTAEHCSTGVVPFCCALRSPRQGAFAHCPGGRYSEHGTLWLLKDKGQNFTSLVAIEALLLTPLVACGSIENTASSNRPFALWQRRARSN